MCSPPAGSIAGQTAELFGFYNMAGTRGALTGSPRLSLLPILGLFLIGAVLLTRVDAAAGRAAVRP